MFNLFISGIGGTEMIFILLIVVVLFGGKKIPELMRGVGTGIREFNNAKNNINSEIKDSMKELDSKEK